MSKHNITILEIPNIKALYAIRWYLSYLLKFQCQMKGNKGIIGLIWLSYKMHTGDQFQIMTREPIPLASKGLPF
jgi:hypothetical protein